MSDTNKGDRPLVVCYGMGVDSTAMLVGMAARGIRPDAILFADTGGERPETYAYLATMNKWLRAQGWPQITVVRYEVKNFKHWPPYRTLEENCLTNGTLPSLAFGFGSCSQKWKAAPQNRWLKTWAPAVECWKNGTKVLKAIGFECGEERRTFRAEAKEDTKFDYWYPLQEWGWDRARCESEISAAGLPVPFKSSCFFCPAMKPNEIRTLPENLLKRIVLMEARAKPRLTDIEGLWRNGCKGMRGAEKKPGAITEFIRDEGLLSAEEIDRIVNECPKELVANQQAFAEGRDIETWDDYFVKLSCPAEAIEMQEVARAE